MESRKTALASWAQRAIAELLGEPAIEISLQAVSGDASFRRYFRVLLPSTSYIVVDSPPERENNQSFVQIAAAFRAAGVFTPEVYRIDYELGFMLQEDFGDTLYLEVLRSSHDAPEAIDRLYKLAIDTLVRLQKRVADEILPAYDRDLLHAEMQLFQVWFCEQFLELTLSDSEQDLIADCLRLLENQALNQPQVAVHRDYHSRNLMIPDADRYRNNHIPGVIDFQDAVSGPYTYDLVSLLRDYYISWPLPYVQALALYYKEAAEKQGVISGIDVATFFRDLDLMGLQRNLKVIGIFARLSIRDNKHQYLADIPQAIRYLTKVAGNYPEIATFLNWFKQRVLPRASEKLPAGNLCEQ